MSAVVVDTSVWVSYLAGRPLPLLEEALAEGRVFLPPIVVSELSSGKMSARHRRELVDLLRDLPLCESGFEHWVRVGELRSGLRGKGITVSTPDAHVAQCCLDAQAGLMSEDRIFRRISEVLAIELVGEV